VKRIGFSPIGFLHLAFGLPSSCRVSPRPTRPDRFPRSFPPASSSTPRSSVAGVLVGPLRLPLCSSRRVSCLRRRRSLASVWFFPRVRFAPPVCAAIPARVLPAAAPCLADSGGWGGERGFRSEGEVEGKRGWKGGKDGRTQGQRRCLILPRLLR